MENIRMFQDEGMKRESKFSTLNLPTPYLFWQCLLYEKVHLFFKGMMHISDDKGVLREREKDK